MASRSPRVNELIMEETVFLYVVCRVLELIHEAKWLSRLAIAIPDSAQQVMSQEARFKGYKDHLELCLQDFQEVLESIPPALKDLFQGHVDRALQNFQPGLTTLAWNSMNIGEWLMIIQMEKGTHRWIS